jgi:SAM-dependent methyltransferase
MTANDSLFAGSIPQLYERYLVPLLFESYALDLAGRVAGLAPRDVLETAAGSGVVTRALAARLPRDVRIMASDLNQPMLDHAASRQAQDGRITWRQADALSLPFADQSFDVAACQFGVMFFPDKVRGYCEARRVLKPGGHFIFNVWDGLAENDFSLVVAEAVASLFPADPPRFLARTPYAYHDIGGIRAELAAAGFAKVSVDKVARTSCAPSPREPAMGLCLGAPLRSEIEARDASRLDEAVNAAAEALARRFGAGPIEGRMSAYVFTAVC